MKVELHCNYCGHKWRMSIYSNSSLEGMRCIKDGCGDRNLTAVELKDYYQEPSKRTGENKKG